MRLIRISAGGIAALIASAVVRQAFKGGPSPKDLKPYVASGLALQFPGPPEKFEVDVPPTVRAKIESMENHQFKARNFEAAVTRVAYVATVQPNIEGALEGALSNAASSQSMSRASNDKKPVTVSGCEGIRFTSVFRKSGQEVEAQGVIFAKGPVLWQLFVIYLKDSAASRETAAKMVESVQVAP